MRKHSRNLKCGRRGTWYTWNADSTLASYPGPGYTRKLSYDEEGRLTKISRDTAGTITPVFEYGYGFDGNRRWRKDLAGNTWDWYPCGVACCAGELVTMRSTNNGTAWTANRSELPVEGAVMSTDGLDLKGVGTTLTTRVNGSSAVGQVVDIFGIKRATSSSSSPTKMGWNVTDEGMNLTKNGANLAAVGGIEEYLLCLWGCSTLEDPIKREICLKGCAVFLPPPGTTPPPSKGCPSGECGFKCPGAKDGGCAPPSTIITCKDGTKIELPKDCAKPKPEPGKGGGGVTIVPIAGPKGYGVGVTIRF